MKVGSAGRPISQIWPQNWLSWQRVLSDREMNERLIKPSHTAFHPENLVKISQLDSEITCLEVESLKRNK